MRVIRFQDENGSLHIGAATDETMTRASRITGDLFGSHEVTDEVVSVSKLLAPLRRPILGIGLNYRRLADHMNAEVPPYPVVFYTHPNAINDPDGEVALPATLAHAKTKYEGELVVVIGKPAKNVPAESALDFVFGYTVGNDICTGEWQGPNVGGQWSKGKGFDGYKPLGPAIVTADQIVDPNNLSIVTRLNAEVVQDESTSDMIHNVQQCISFLSQGHTLSPGDLIYTGTPFGTPGCHDKARMLQSGDVVSVTIDGIGTLTNRIVDERGTKT